MKQSITRLLQKILTKQNASINDHILALQKTLSNQKYGKKNKNILNELRQIFEARTNQRKRYYIQRLIRGLTEVKSGKLNDFNLNRWKDYADILTDSLWLVEKRDRSGNHSAGYWGNFVPQIPNQLIRRYTKSNEWVLDPFLGSGTTLLECRQLGRNGLGIEIQNSIAQKTRNALYNVGADINSPAHCIVITGDSTRLNFVQQLKNLGIPSVHLAILHPPYWDIIRFSKRKGDLSNAKSLPAFLESFGNVVKNCASVLDNKRFLAVVIGDKYSAREWIPLGFLSMQEVLKHGFKLKSIIVKNFNQTKAKRNQEELWRYRALVGGFYVFKHEYIFLFQKK
jgi:DNA modification methylase